MNFYSLFKRYEIPKHFESIVDSFIIENAAASRKLRSVKLTLRFCKVVDRSDFYTLIHEVQQTYELAEIETKICHDNGLFCKDNFDKIIEIIKAEIPAANGFLNDCIISQSGNVLNIELQHGGYGLLLASKCDKAIEDLLKQEFGQTLKVNFIGNLSCGVQTQERIISAVVPKAKEKKKTVREKSHGGYIKSTPTASIKSKILLLGKEMKQGDVVPLSSVTVESGRVTVCGRLFDIKVKLRRNGELIIVSLDITDDVYSLRASKMFKRREAALFLNMLCSETEDENESILGKEEKTIAKMCKGKTLVMRGDAEYNRYEQDSVMRLIDAAIIEAKKDYDTQEEKRVELHLHTNMSDMDGINSIEDYIKTAKRWGHKAIAVTDHGVLQAYPEAMKAAKDNDIKVIYGIENYFVNDTVPAAFGGIKRDLQKTRYIIFDLETTGLSPSHEGITEIGAVVLENGEITDSFHSFVNPNKPISAKITEITGITDAMVKDAPSCKEALTKFYDFCGDGVLVAHNAPFDTGFLRVHGERLELPFNFDYIDTVPICRYMLPKQKRHKLNLVADALGLGDFRHHRATDDATVLAKIFIKILERLNEDGITKIGEINNLIAGERNYKNLPSYHQVILVKNYIGLKNLYKLVSYSNLNYFYKKPRMLKSLIMQHREGLIIGSACDAGELYIAVREGLPQSDIERIAGFYDYLEIQPLGNCRHLVVSGKVKDEEELKKINKSIYELGKKLNKPVAATGDVHFLRPTDEVFRRILMAGKGFSDADDQPPLYFRTTQDMLNEFSYLGEEAAYEVVVANTNKIADMCEAIRPIPSGKYPPHIEGAPEELRYLSETRAAEIYGMPLPKIVAERMENELNSIITNGFSVMYIIAQKLVLKSLSDGYLVGSRGSVGSSFVAFLSGITEVNALCPHYICPKCKYSEFLEECDYGTGADMPDKNCPVCGTELKKDGFDIPFETFLGFDGDKEPDIDLNFSGTYQPVAHKFIEELFGNGYVFRAGTIGTVAEKTAYGYVKKYLDERNRVVTKAEENRLTAGCTGVKRTSGQHPGGIIIVPKDKEIYDFCPIQHPADDTNSEIITTHFDYHSIHDNLLKLDILGHDDPTVIRMLEDLTGLDARSIRLDDKATMSIFTSCDALKMINPEPEGTVGSLGIPEFGTRFVRQMLIDTKPTTFIELVNISGLSHGTDVWLNNAQDLVRANTASLSEVICTRDDIMRFLLHIGLPKKESFTIMEGVRKGKGLKPEQEKMMREYNVPDWYIDSCKKIKYMFPKAHAVAYCIMAFRIAYFKVYYPLEFYCVYFTVRADSFDAKYMIRGLDIAQKAIEEIEQNPNATNKEKDMVTILEICCEMYKRGFNFCPVDIYKSHPTNFEITENGIRPPLTALQGLGASAAASIAKAREDGPFTSQDELIGRARVSKAVVDILEESGALLDIPKSSQLSLF